LNDPLGLTIEDESSEGEPRWITIGANASGALLVVVWSERDDGERLISVRRATARSVYQTLVNEALAQHIGAAQKPMTAEQVRKIVREELTHTR
jgi:hypothetical protein